MNNNENKCTSHFGRRTSPKTTTGRIFPTPGLKASRFQAKTRKSSNESKLLKIKFRFFCHVYEMTRVLTKRRDINGIFLIITLYTMHTVLVPYPAHAFKRVGAGGLMGLRTEASLPLSVQRSMTFTWISRLGAMSHSTAGFSGKVVCTAVIHCIPRSTVGDRERKKKMKWRKTFIF